LVASVKILLAAGFYFGDSSIAAHANYLGKLIILKLFFNKTQRQKG